MAVERLIGSDGKLAFVDLGTPLVANADLVAGEYYSVISRDATSSALPAGAEPLVVFRANDSETLAEGDSVYWIDQTDSCDITSWSVANALAEVAVTTLCDTENKYRAGKGDVTGSMEGVFTVGTTDIANGIMSRFSVIAEQAGEGGAVTVSEINGDPIIAMFYIQKDDSAGETVEFIFAPVTLLGFNNTVGTDAQNFTSNFRIAPSSDIKKQTVKTKMI